MSELSGFARHSAADYADALARLLPTGSAWTRDRNSILMGFVAGQSAIWGNVIDARAADLLERETDPRATLDLLLEWERAFGLPDPCATEALTIADRRAALMNRMVTQGGQSCAFFIGVAAALGYAITIVERSPFMVGLSGVGDTRDTAGSYRWEIGPPEIRYAWTVRVGSGRFSWFRAGSGQAGVDPHLRIALAEDLECLVRRWKPAHTMVFFDYSGLASAYALLDEAGQPVLDDNGEYILDDGASYAYSMAGTP